MRKYLPAIFFINLILPAWAINISGTIVDDENQPLTGATIKAPDKNIWTISDSNGNFTLKNFPDNTNVIISFVGRETKELSPSEDMGTIKLLSTAPSIGEVIVTGCNLKTLNAEIAEYDPESEKCHPTKCKEGFALNADKTSCEKTDGDCTPDQAAAVENATATALKNGKCIATECKDGFEIKNDKCKAAQEIQQKNSPQLSKEDAANRMDELQANAKALKDNERSTENKLLGAAGIATVGIGLSQTMSAKAEQSADETAEQDMRAHLATFRCTYGGSTSIQGGEKEIQLPVIDLSKNKSEYITTAAALKEMKASLGLMPGIESEEIIDAATSGLYDDVAIGKTSGAFTSLSRAITDATSADAAAWEKQKADSASKLKTGAIMAGAGAVGTAIGNALINKNAPQDKSREINAKYDKLKKMADTAATDQEKIPSKKCSEFTGTTQNGNAPDCSCSDKNARFFPDAGGCVTCDGGKSYNDQNECVCPADRPVEQNGTCAAASAGCALTGLVETSSCACIQNAMQIGNACICDGGNGFVKNADGKCEKIPTPARTTPKIDVPDLDFSEFETNEILPFASKSGDTIFNFSFKSDKLFASGKSTLSSAATTEFLNDFRTKLDAALKEQNINLAQMDYCVQLTGHTDRTPIKKGIKLTNQSLSEARAKTIKDVLTKNNTPLKAENTISHGVGESNCSVSEYPAANSPECRRVEINITTGACKS